MIRPISILVGLGFSVAVLWAFGNGAYVAMTEGMGEQSAEYAIHEKPHGPEGAGGPAVATPPPPPPTPPPPGPTVVTPPPPPLGVVAGAGTTTPLKSLGVWTT